ncbi:helix-turn-helix domain-containing protein [Pseudarthrobacter sp. N5]|uniref:helix-turn-helix domain-containing protein n=1 Tax=Pseudarthrobacter sp. N5 TaxID=3418416 RepID=UPI003CF9CD20
MVGKKMELGATGEAVAHNVKRLREAANLTYTEVSRGITDLKRSISPLAIRRIEEMERRVDVDDLMALALVLDVTPISLLYPGAESGEEEVRATGLKSPVSAKSLWGWMSAESPLSERDRMERYEFLGWVLPMWRRQELGEELSGWAGAVASHAPWTPGDDQGKQDATEYINGLLGDMERGATGSRRQKSVSDGDD